MLDNQYVIEIHRDNGFYFLCEYEGTQHMTWDKYFAKRFLSIEQAENYIEENELRKYNKFKGTLKIKKFSEVSSH